MQFRLRRVAAFVSSPIRLFGLYLVLLWIRWCLPRDAMHKHGLCRHAVSVSVTFMSCIKTNKDIFEMFSPSCIQAILVFPCQTGWRMAIFHVCDGLDIIYAGDGGQPPPDTTPLVITPFSAAVGHRRTEPGGYFCWKLTLPTLLTLSNPRLGVPIHKRQQTRAVMI